MHRPVNVLLSSDSSHLIVFKADVNAECPLVYLDFVHAPEGRVSTFTRYLFWVHGNYTDVHMTAAVYFDIIHTSGLVT